MPTEPLDSREFRRILGHYPTGVCAITAMHGGAPKGLIVGSFTSVSLDPPLVAFLPDRRSKSWPEIEAAGHFCVNVLSDQQQDICGALASKAEDKFAALPYRLSSAGHPIFEGAVAWIECRLYAVHEAGDHYIAIGEVIDLDVGAPHPPLLFLQGKYGSFLPAAEL
ncbi:flavin reductase (DIM6/NTAB) family NADH-FMN oxidoreductase RutF [Sphingomonas vulcanisoli]|uniref:Flavin reductase (DIM6/NTAB) family NADH-FMN oxidoreductase RutF n=1 Tax=Sphingomonas vulcanisoli TaxID=1658060 RepID=A0ABX0TSD3_9SPHN|nr:flavin reductase family protein [Sphingomonas vulcanisoli]NIJ07287.1 flavin reductase (DIM6/NTAB) family NADH-FMN oxidoreductase RutF [Sphingomonas vulcanisoli]